MITERNDRGFTLIETMVAVVISMMLIAAASATYVVQNRSYTAQEDVTEMNTQVKVAHDLIKRTIKGSPFSFSFNMSTEIPATLFGFNSTIVPSDFGGGPDAITVITARRIGELWPTGMNAGTNEDCDGNNSDDQKLELDSGGADIILDDPLVGPVAGSTLLLGGIEFATVASFTGTAVTFVTTTGQNHWLEDTDGDSFCDKGRPVYLLQDTTFCVDADANLHKIDLGVVLPACTGSPLGPFNQIIAENIEDLQFSYAVDVVAPFGEIDGSANLLDDTDFTSIVAPANYSRIRAVRINILTMSQTSDLSFRGMGNPPAAIENNIIPQPGDDFKRRWQQSIVFVKNLEGVL
ncbi:MAG: PilW family protein [Nitrospirota bacterium]